MVRGLLGSEENYSTNGMDLNADDKVLYVARGDHDNKGAPSNNFAGTPEYALSAAILSVDLDAIEVPPVQTDGAGQNYVYDLPTLDDPICNGTSSPDANDPFGGNNGLNQVCIVPGGRSRSSRPGTATPTTWNSPKPVAQRNLHRLLLRSRPPGTTQPQVSINNGDTTTDLGGLLTPSCSTPTARPVI